MRRILELVAATVLFAAASFAFLHWVAAPYHCNLRVKQATGRLQLAVSLADKSMRALRLARINVEELSPCVDRSPSDIGAAMVLAGSHRVLGHDIEAVSLYQRALSYDRRPELYFNLGQTQLGIGDRKSGIQNLITACIYDPVYYDEIGEDQAEVKNAVRAYIVAHTKRD